MEEQPCPQRIPFDSGVAFSLGVVLGSTWNAIKGFREHPTQRWFGVKKMVRKNAPRLGGNFAAWGTLFSISECSLVGIRGTDDWMNRVASGAFTSGALAIRGGKGAMLRGGIVGGVLLGLIEGVSYCMSRYMSPDPAMMMTEEQKQQQYEDEMRRRAAQAVANQDSNAQFNTPTLSSQEEEEVNFSDHGVEMTTEQTEQQPKKSSGGFFTRRSAW